MTDSKLAYFAIIAWDGRNGVAIRANVRDAHLAYITQYIGDYAIAGPLRNEAGEFLGSMLIVKANSLDAATAMLHADPYYIAGLWDRVTISAFTPAAGDWIGGTIW